MATCEQKDLSVEQFIQNCINWPSFPATLLLGLVCLYWTLVVLGAADLDFLDIDVDLDMDADIDIAGDPSILQFGFLPLKWLNIGSVPTMLWVSIFSLTGWMVSRLWNSPLAHPSFDYRTDILAIMRDFGIAALATKVLTQPLRGKFDPVEPNKSEDLVGKVCIVTTSEVTETFGEAELATDGAPLKLKVRNSNDNLAKGDTALIVDFQSEGNLYFVAKFDVP